MVDNSSETGMQTHEDNISSCVRCSELCEFRNIGREHWFYCETCQIKWCAGENLFSGWREQSDKVFEENQEYLKDFEDLTVYSGFAGDQMQLTEGNSA